MKHKTRMNTLAAMLLCLVIILGGMPVSALAEEPDEHYYLPLFQTSDVHGYIANTASDKTLYTLAYISDRVKDIRGYGETYRKDKAVLLDAGDIYQGNTMSNLLEGNSMSAAYTIMDYDAVTIGNHEFDRGIENMIDADRTMMDYDLGEISGVNSIPVVESNIYKDDVRFDLADDYVILLKTATNGKGDELPVRIGVIGFAGQYTGDIKYSSFTGAGYSIRPDYDRINELALFLETEQDCDATIVLTHEVAKTVAEAIGVSNVDLVLGGHSHNNDSGVTEAGITYLQPCNYAQAYTYCELSFLEAAGDPVLDEIAEAGPVATDPARMTKTAKNADFLDPALVTLTDTVLVQLSDILDTMVGYITVNASRETYIDESGERSTVAGNWITSVMARMYDADVAFTNNGSIRAEWLLSEGSDKRVITVSDIYEMFPFDNVMYCYEISYEDLLKVLEYALTDKGKTVFSQGWGVSCYYTDETVNAMVTKDGQLIYHDGVWTDGWKDRTLHVSISDYTATNNKISEHGVKNPFLEWNQTERLVSTYLIDSEAALDVLREEAAENNGLLSVDTRAYFINSAYVIPADDTPDNTSSTEPKTETPVNADVADTADRSHLVFWFVLMSGSMEASLVFAAMLRRKNRPFFSRKPMYQRY